MLGFFLRWAIALVLVLATFNPTQWNYARWVVDHGAENMSVAALAGLVLLVGYVIYLRATFRSIGPVGILLVAAIFGALVWVLVDLGVLRLDDSTVLTWVGLICLSLVMAIGLNWSIVRRHLSGQADIDDIDE